jgi:hypothetical protein
MNITFKPASPVPSDAENTTYFVFIKYEPDDEYEPCAGVITKNGNGWAYYVDGTEMTDTYDDRCELFQLVKEDPLQQA